MTGIWRIQAVFRLWGWWPTPRLTDPAVPAPAGGHDTTDSPDSQVHQGSSPMTTLQHATRRGVSPLRAGLTAGAAVLGLLLGLPTGGRAGFVFTKIADNSGPFDRFVNAAAINRSGTVASSANLRDGNEAPRPEAEVSGRPPRGGRSRGAAPSGGGQGRRIGQRRPIPINRRRESWQRQRGPNRRGPRAGP